MDRITIALLILVVIISLLWLYNAIILTEQRRLELDDLYNKLLGCNDQEYNDKAILHMKIQSLNDLDRWSWEFISGLWLFTMTGLIIYRMTM